MCAMTKLGRVKASFTVFEHTSYPLASYRPRVSPRARRSERKPPTGCNRPLPTRTLLVGRWNDRAKRDETREDRDDSAHRLSRAVPRSPKSEVISICTQRKSQLEIPN